MDCGVPYESVCLPARGHVIRVWVDGSVRKKQLRPA